MIDRFPQDIFIAAQKAQSFRTNPSYCQDLLSQYRVAGNRLATLIQQSSVDLVVGSLDDIISLAGSGRLPGMAAPFKSSRGTVSVGFSSTPQQVEYLLDVSQVVGNGYFPPPNYL